MWYNDRDSFINERRFLDEGIKKDSHINRVGNGGVCNTTLQY